MCRALVSDDNDTDNEDEDDGNDDGDGDDDNEDNDDIDDVDYKQVSEALELSSFMEKISSSRLNETIDGEVRLPLHHHHHHQFCS